MVHFGPQKKEREDKLAELYGEKGPIWKLNADEDDITTIGATNVASQNGSGIKPVPKLNDIIGASLKYVGPYKKLDNKKQVVALIDDVSSLESRMTKRSHSTIFIFMI